MDKMADLKFQKKLNSFLEREVIRESDYKTYIGVLSDLAMCLENENSFNVYASVVKNWMSGFQTIFSKNKTQKDASTCWDTYMSEFCATTTKILFILLQHFRQFDPNYTQEFYIHWKTIISRMNGLKRADIFQANVDQFKIVIQHLRTAATRTEQFAILSVLRLYMECVPSSDICRLNEHDNAEIVRKVSEFMQNPTILNQHAFLQDIDALGHFIDSVKPTKIKCRKLKIDMDDTDYEMWLDFNKTEKSITFATVCLADCHYQTFATARHVTLRENVFDEHLLEIVGIWNVISVDTAQAAGQKVRVKFFLPDKTEQLISNSVKTIYRFANSTDGTTGSQGCTTDYTEPELTLDDGKVSPQKVAPLNESYMSVTTPELVPIVYSYSQPTPPKSFHAVRHLNASLPLFTRTEHEMGETEAELPGKSNLTYVIRRSVTSMGTPNGQLHSDDDPNGTYFLRKSVNPIAAEQPENDHDDSQTYDNYGEIDVDVECTPIQPVNVNKSLATNRTYTIRDGALSHHSNEADRLADHEYASAKLLYQDDMMLDEYDDAENERPKSESRYGGKKIEILENITIVPPTPQPKLPEPMRHFYRENQENEKYSRCSQVDERISLNRKKAHTQYSQPTTALERLYVKDSSVPARTIEATKSNESVQRVSQRPIQVSRTKMHSNNRSEIDDQLNESLRSNRKVSWVPLTPITMQNSCNHDDDKLNVSTEITQRIQAASPRPIEFPCNSQYDTFSPLATSTQRSPVRLRRASHSQRALQLSQDPIEMNSSPSFGKSFYHKSMTLTGSSQHKAGSSKVNKSLSQTTDVPPQVDGTSDQKIDINSSSLQTQATPVATPKRAKCIAIADLPKMSQSHIGLTTESQKEKKSSQIESKAMPKFAFTQNSFEKQHIEVPIIDSHVELSQSKTQSMSVLQREQNSEELHATLNEPSTRNSSQMQATSSPRQPIQSVPIIDPYVEEEPCQKSQSLQSAFGSRTAKMSEAASNITQSSSQRQTLTSDPQLLDNDEFIDLPDDMDCLPSTPNQQRRKMSESLADSTTTKNSQREAISSEDPKMSMAKRQQNMAPARNIAKNAPKTRAQPLKANILKLLFSTIAAQNGTNQATLVGEHNSRKLPTSWFDDTEVHHQCNKLEVAKDSLYGETFENENVVTDGIRVDEQGTVYDGECAVFADNEELQRATKFYIANDGLSYLKRESVAALPAKKREKYERKLRTIQRMIDRGLEGMPSEGAKIKDIDPYALTIEDTIIQGKKRKLPIKKVTITMSTKTIVDNGKRLTFARRISNLLVIVDEGPSTDSKSTDVNKKSMTKGKRLFKKPKISQTVKTPHPLSVNLSERKVNNRQNGTTPAIPTTRPVTEPYSNFLEIDQMESRDDNVAGANMTPISASSKTGAKRQKTHNENCSTRPAERSLPIYASKEMADAYQQKMTTKTKRDLPSQRRRDESPSTNVDCLAGDLMKDHTMADDCEMEQDLCSTTTCSHNMKDLLGHLRGIEMESGHNCQGPCEQNLNIVKTFIDRLQRRQFHKDAPTADWAQLFDCVLESMESWINTAADQLQVCQEEGNE